MGFSYLKDKKVSDCLRFYAAGAVLVLSLLLSLNAYAEGMSTLEESNAEGFDYSVLFDVPPSDSFASGAAFDISYQNRDAFLEALKSGDVSLLHLLFVEAYTVFKESPEVVGYTAEMIHEEKEDTNPQQWNTDFLSSLQGIMRLCYISLWKMKISQPGL